MFTIIYRRLQKHAVWLKLLGFVFSLLCLGSLIMFVAPTILNVVLAAFLIFALLFLTLSFFIASRLAILISLTISFLFFFRAVDLFSIANVTLLLVFLALLAFYFKKTPEEKKKTEPEKPKNEILFPKNWPFRIAKPKKQEYNQNDDNH